jgi:hypothetical protein
MSVVMDDSTVVCAVVENRVREVGLAILNISSPSLILATVSDTHQYDHTLSKLGVFNLSKVHYTSTLA